MELRSEVRSGLVSNTFVTSIVGIGEKDLPIFTEGVAVDVISMVLALV